jgi:hypothetical protein
MTGSLLRAFAALSVLALGSGLFGCKWETALPADGFHIIPSANGEQQLSPFLDDPSTPNDELRRRIEWMQLTLSRSPGSG